MTNDKKFVIDVNVIVSAFSFEESKPYQALDKAQNLGILLMSHVITVELTEVFSTA